MIVIAGSYDQDQGGMGAFQEYPQVSVINLSYTNILYTYHYIGCVYVCSYGYSVALFCVGNLTIFKAGYVGIDWYSILASMLCHANVTL